MKGREEIFGVSVRRCEHTLKSEFRKTMRSCGFGAPGSVAPRHAVECVMLAALLGGPGYCAAAGGDHAVPVPK